MSASNRSEKSRAAARLAARQSAAESSARAAGQIDLFPVQPTIDVLDPRQVVGEATTVAYLIRVRLRPKDPPHLVFHDRHGWYCETHGTDCAAVALAREAVGQ